MRALKFMKIEYIKIKQQALLFPLFWLIAFYFAFGREHFGGGMSLVGAFSYMMFFAMIFCTAPFGVGERKEAGFLILLPSTTAHKVLGRFLYALSLVVMEIVIMGGVLLVKRGMGDEISGLTLPICLIILSVTLVVIALEFAFFYLVGEQVGAQLLSIIRIVPGMALFFGISSFIGAITEEGVDLEAVTGVFQWIMENLGAIGWCSLAVAAVVMAVVIVVCVRVLEKRDYS